MGVNTQIHWKPIGLTSTVNWFSIGLPHPSNQCFFLGNPCTLFVTRGLGWISCGNPVAFTPATIRSRHWFALKPISVTMDMGGGALSATPAMAGRLFEMYKVT
jgi:hypothetical protein